MSQKRYDQLDSIIYLSPVANLFLKFRIKITLSIFQKILKQKMSSKMHILELINKSPARGYKAL